MNNLKRVLSLALSGIMLVGMMAIGASAADFSDAEKIEHSDAVNTLVALNIINGQDDGSFNPEGDVTRAQMAKMIAVAMNGGTETNTGVKGTASFTDIKGHWAESYIEYCYDLGIISGRGDGTFDPEGKVTAIEATKMVLTALGYDSEAYELTGPKWATQADQLARMASPTLYEELAGMTLTAPASRDTAAQLIWNGMQNQTVRIKPNQDRDSSGKTSWGYDKTGVTLLKERYNGEVREAYLSDVDYDKDTETFTYTLDNSAVFGAEAIALPANGGNGVNGTFDYTEDVSELFGQKVKVVYKANKTKDVYSIFASGSTVLADAVVGKDLKVDPADKSVKLDKISYKFGPMVASRVKDTADQVPVYNFLDNTSVENLDDLKAATAKHIFAAKVIDNDDDGKINCVVITPIEVAKVTFVGKNSITAGTGVYKFDDCDIYEDVKKDDWAVITDGDFVGTGIDTVVKAEIVNGTISATREVGKEAKIDDVWYTDAPAGKTGDSYVVDEEFNLTVVNKYVIDAEAVTSAADVTNAVYVLKADGAGAAGSTKEGTEQVRLLFADDTKKVVTVDEIDDADVADGSNETTVGALYTFSVKKNGNYKLTSIKNADFDANDAADGTNAISIKEGRATSTGLSKDYRFDNDAVVFVAYSTNKVKAVSGATINKWKQVTTTNAAANNVLYADKNSNGFYAVRLAKFDLGAANIPSSSGDKAYGWVTAKPEVVKKDDNWYIQLQIWNGEEDITVLTEENSSRMELQSMTNSAPYKKGTPISYDDLNNGEIENATSLLSGLNGVAGYNEDKDIEFRAVAGNGFRTGNITKDTVIVYVNMEDNVGAEGGSIVLAPTDADGVALDNCYANIDAQGDVVYIFVDVNNNIGTDYAADSFTANGTISGTRQGSGNVEANSVVTYRFVDSSNAGGNFKVAYGKQEKVITIPAGASAYVDVDFLKTVGATTGTIAKQVVYSAITPSGSNTDGLTATAVVASGDHFEGDTVKITVTLDKAPTATDTTVTLGAATTGAKAITTGTGVTKTSETKYTVGTDLENLVLEFTITATAGETAPTITLGN